MLTVVTVAYPLAPLGPDAVGGAEQVASSVERALVAAGHRSIVIARADSTCAGRLVSLPVPARPFDHATICAAHEACRRAIAGVLARERVDVVHMHGTDFHYYAPEGGHTIATLHRWPDWYPPAILNSSGQRLTLQCVSEAQRRACPEPERMVVIPNGTNTDKWRPRRYKGDYALMLGRICPEKGVHDGIEAATAAGISLRIAGRVFPYPLHCEYFDTQVRPRLNRRVRFVGSVTGLRKGDLLARARCVLFPSAVPETSSLVAMEALASGTPVVAFRSPALAELIEDGRTGFLVDDLNGMADALRQVRSLSPAACRAAALARCRESQMTRGYLKLFERCAGAP